MTTKLSNVNVAELLGPTPIARVTDREICSLLLSPQTKALLGPIETAIHGPRLHETDSPLFPGDEVSNLNNHQLYGGKTGFIRFPYVATIYKTAYGALVIKRDQHKFKVQAYIGDISKGRAELIYMAALRDRRFDGTLRGNDCALLSFPYDEKGNAPLPVDASSVEVSVYAFSPGSRIAHASGDADLEKFVANPFKILDDPQKFRHLLDRAWASQRSPGQVGAPIGDISKYIGPRFDLIAKSKGYDFLEDAASHYHVAMYAMSMGYRCTYEDQEKQLAEFKAGIERIKASGVKLTRQQESWVCVMQSLPVELIPPQFYLGGIKWPQDNISQTNLWMNKPLSDKARLLIPGSLKREVPAGSAS